MRVTSLSQSLVLRLFLGVGGIVLVDARVAEWVALGLIVFAGIPHGAFDLHVARRGWGVERSLVWVVGAYILLGVAMSAVCLLAPTLGLTIFLVVSVLHFAAGEKLTIGVTGGYVVGAAAVALPISLHLSDAMGYLRFFVDPVTVGAFTSSLFWGGTVLAVAAVITAIERLSQGAKQDSFELLLCVGAWCFFPPLAGFAVWFIGRHSHHHLARCRAMFARGPRLFTPDAMVISAVAILLMVPLGRIFDLTDLEQLFTASIVLIAGLTLPHMVVTHRLEASTQGGI